MLVLDLIKASLRKIGAIATGETPTADEANDALQTLNDMLESWQNERLTVRSLTLATFAATPGVLSYTLGPGGTLPLAYYPIEVESGFYGMGGYDLPLYKLNQQQYDDIGIKGLPNTVAWAFYPENAYPLIGIKLYPAPSGAQSLNFRVWKPVAAFANLQETVTLPPGWQRALIFNLARDLCPEYGQDVPANVEAIATEAKANIKRVNRPKLIQTSDPGLLAIGGAKASNGRSFIQSGIA